MSILNNPCMLRAGGNRLINDCKATNEFIILIY